MTDTEEQQFLSHLKQVGTAIDTGAPLPEATLQRFAFYACKTYEAYVALRAKQRTVPPIDTHTLVHTAMRDLLANVRTPRLSRS